MAAIDDAAGAEEKECLEEGVGDEMEKACHPAADAERQHHVTELADGGIGQYLLDVRHDKGNRRRHEEGDAAGVGDNQAGLDAEEWINPADQVNTGCDHRCRMDQGADRGRAFHRVRQPDVQRELRGLADAAEEDAQAGDDQ